MKLYYTKRSPYARKVLLVAHEKGLSADIAPFEVDLSNLPPEVVEYNPLGKIPTLVLEDGKSIYDSPVICRYLDELREKPLLIPAGGFARYQVLRIEALADGIMDAAVVAYMEAQKPAAKQDEAVITKQRNVITRVLAVMETMPEFFELGLTLGQLAAAAAIGYVEFRLKDLNWRPLSPELARWYDEFKHRPAMQATLPSA